MRDESASGAEATGIGASFAWLQTTTVAIVAGFFCGAGLAVATLWLVIQDGPNVGLHLSLLSNYFPGYTVSLRGALVGFAYAAVLGATIGWCTAWIYNRIANHRSGR